MIITRAPVYSHKHPSVDKKLYGHVLVYHTILTLLADTLIIFILVVKQWSKPIKFIL